MIECAERLNTEIKGKTTHDGEEQLELWGQLLF
jgi:hypothetical protein